MHPQADDYLEHIERLNVDILIRQERKVSNESGAVVSVELGDLFSRIQYEVEERLLGDMDPWKRDPIEWQTR